VGVTKARQGGRERTSDAGEELSGKVLDVTDGEGREGVVLEEVEDGGAEKLKDEANMVPVVEAFRQVNTFAVG
jgi:hypothetical protein